MTVTEKRTTKKDISAKQPSKEVANSTKSDHVDGSVVDFANKAKDVAGQVWLAGLGAYVKVEQEGVKWFDTLVKDGERLEEKTKELLDRQLSYYRDKVGGVKEKVEEVKGMATSSIDRIEKAFDERVSRALARLKIPSQKDIQALRKQVDALQRTVASLSDSKHESHEKVPAAKTKPKKGSSSEKQSAALSGKKGAGSKPDVQPQAEPVKHHRVNEESVADA